MWVDKAGMDKLRVSSSSRVLVGVEFELEFELIRCRGEKGQALQTFTMWSDYGKVFSSDIML